MPHITAIEYVTKNHTITTWLNFFHNIFLYVGEKKAEQDKAILSH